MKLNKLILSFILLTNTIFSQINTVENSFFGCEPASFKFYTIGNTHSGQSWNDDQGNTSTTDTATFIFPIQGTYNVKIGSLTQTITIYPKLVYNFFTDSSTTGCFPFKFNLRDATAYPAGIIPTKHNWTYQNGGGKSGNPIKDIIVTYYNYNCFVVMNVETNNPGCNGNVTIPDYFKILDNPTAKISAIPSFSCKVPFTLQLNNFSHDSFKTDLNFLWKWSKPSPGTSTDSIPLPITYNTNLKDKIYLEVTNKFNCKSYDTIEVGIDTPSFDFIVPQKACVNHPDSFDLYIINREVAGFEISLSSSTYLLGRIVNDTQYRIYPNRRPTNFYPITLTKSSKTDPTCKTSITKLIYLINDYPDAYFYQNSPCKSPISDTIVARKVTKNVDSIIYRISYYDKYGVTVKDTTYGDGKASIYKRLKTDTVQIHKILNYKDIDSYYRKGPLNIYIEVTFVNSETRCYMTDTISAFKNSIFRAHMISDTNIGCTSKPNNFKVIRLGNDKIDSVTWFFGDNIVENTKGDSSRKHTYNAEGIYRAFAIVKNTFGCIDTTNPLIVKRGDSVIPQLSISNRNLCISDTTNFTITNPLKYDRWFFVTDSFKSYNCPNETNFTWPHFYNVGKQYVYLIASKNGCITKLKDSVFIDGPRFFLDYDFKCNRRDSIKFYLRDTFGMRSLFNTWNFGDGTIINTMSDTIWHKFYGDSVDRIVKVTSTNPSGCSFTDSTIVKIRNVKAIFTDSFFCKETNPNEILNLTPYYLNPNKSRNADYLCNYRYTWQLSSIANPPVKYPPYTYGGAVNIDIPLDTMNLTLIARDVNGCIDTMTKRVIVTDNFIDFKITGSSICPPSAQLVIQNLSASIFGIKSYKWSIYRFKDNNAVQPSLKDDTVRNPIFNVNKSQSDSFIIYLEIEDSNSCAIKSLTKIFSFFVDTSKLIIPIEICQNQSDQIKCNEDNVSKFSYRWYVNGVLTTDTLASFKYKFQNLGKFEVVLKKQHRQTGCIHTFLDSTLVKAKPKLRLDNTFDTATNRCFPAVTSIGFFDSIFVAGVGFYFEHNGNKTSLNPSNISLNGGINPIRFVYSTTYGCLDTLINYDTVVKPRGDLTMSKSMICKGDTIEFTLINPQDIDTVHWVFGDGNEHYGIERSVKYNFPKANLISDTIRMSYIAYAINKLCPISTLVPIVVLEAKASHYINNKIDTAFCFGQVPIHNTSTRADYFKWDYGNGKMDTNSNINFNYSFDFPGKYPVKLYAYRKPLACVDSSLHYIELYPKPEISANRDTICFGKDFLLSYYDTLPNTQVSIFPDYHKKNPYVTSPIKVRMTNPLDTSVTLISRSNYGCLDTFKVSLLTIRLDSLPQLDTIVENGKKVTIPLKILPNYIYTWSPALLNPSCLNCSYPLLQVFTPAIYKVTITDILGCFTDTSHFYINIYPDIKVVVPTAFTPNGDGNNDFIYARGFGIKRLLSFKIYNRLGQLLFMTDNESIGWDGYYKSVMQNTDTYFYTYEAEAFIPGKFISGEGNFILMR